MSLQFLENTNPPPSQSLLEYDVQPGTVFISTGNELLYVDLTITVTNTTSAPVNCMEFQFGFLAGAGAGDLTTINEAGSVTPASDQNEWGITTAGFSDSTNPNLYLFAATPSGLADFLPLDAGSSLTFHLTNILVDQSVGEGDAPFTIVEQTGTNRPTRKTVSGTIGITKEIGSLGIPIFSVDPPEIAPGTPILLSWSLTGSDHWELYDADTATKLYDSGTGTPPNLMQWPLPPQQLTPEQDTNYELMAWAGAVFTSRQASAIVSAPQVTAQGPTQPVDALSEVTITWQSVNATTVVIEPTGQTANAGSNQGTFSVQPTEDTLYTLTATGANNTTGKATVQVYVIPPAVVSFVATPNLFAPGATVELSWQTTSAVSASLSSITLGSKEVISMGSVDVNSDGYPVQPTGITTYILTLEGQGQTPGQIAVAPTPQNLTQNVGGYPTGEMVYDNVSQVMWVVNQWLSIMPLTASNGTVVGQPVSLGESLPSDPSALAMAFDGTYIWVGIELGGLTQIRASDGVVIASGILQESMIQAFHILYDSVNELLLVSHDGVLSRINMSNMTLAGPDLQFDVASWTNVTFDGVNVWVPISNYEKLYLIRASDGTIIKTVTSDAGCLTFDGNNVWAGCGTNSVRKFDSEGNVLASYPCGTYPTAIISDGTNIWTANEDSTLSMFNAMDGTLLATFQIGISPNFLACDGASIWILGSDDNNPDGAMPALLKV